MCVPNGNPASYIFSKWEHKSEFGERIRYLNGYLNGSLVLPYRQSHSYQDTGIYKCTVSNGIPDTHGQFNQSQDGFLAIQGTFLIFMIIKLNNLEHKCVSKHTRVGIPLNMLLKIT